jgi:hypothetical protein
MPDKIVICFTMNRQSIEGAASVAEAIISQQQNMSFDKPAVRIFPIVTRVELAEKEKLDLARQYISAKFSRFLGHLPNNQLARIP